MKKLLIFSLLLLVMLIGYEIFFVHSDHTYFTWQKWKSFYGALGLVGSVTLMLFAKFIGKHFLYRSESYYKDES